ncbi:hypothetical protein RB195_024453 [Necator americanus]|uniref:Uncharacterized protein n=1 Tax=Necator americanus TaxID=51031 RepID=A0ABR1EN88_NECAM
MSEDLCKFYPTKETSDKGSRLTDLCIRKSRAVWDIAFDYDHRPVLLCFMVRFQKRSREVQDQPRLDMADLKADECRKKFRKRVSISTGLRTEKEVDDVKHGKHDKYWITS